jgi:hypothetical protein
VCKEASLSNSRSSGIDDLIEVENVSQQTPASAATLIVVVVVIVVSSHRLGWLLISRLLVDRLLVGRLLVLGSGLQ